jgi:hypothetical protein
LQDNSAFQVVSIERVLKKQNLLVVHSQQIDQAFQAAQ